MTVLPLLHHLVSQCTWLPQPAVFLQSETHLCWSHTTVHCQISLSVSLSPSSVRTEGTTLYRRVCTEDKTQGLARGVRSVYAMKDRQTDRRGTFHCSLQTQVLEMGMVLVTPSYPQSCPPLHSLRSSSPICRCAKSGICVLSLV